MGAKTKTFPVDDVNKNPYTVQTICRVIRIGPVNGAASYDFRAPSSGDDPVRKFNGEVTVLTRPSPGQYQQGTYGDTGLFNPGDKPAFFTNVSGLGALTYQAEEFQ